MRKLIKGKHEKRCSFLERKGDRRSRWIVDSTLFEYGKPADVFRLKSVFSLTSYLLTLTYLLMVRHRPTAAQDVPTCEPQARTDHEPKAHLYMFVRGEVEECYI